MARTKQTARKSTGGKAPQKQLASPPPEAANYDSDSEQTESEDDEDNDDFLANDELMVEEKSKGKKKAVRKRARTGAQTASLNKILSPAVLKAQKGSLKTSAFQPVALERDGLLESAEPHGCLPMVSTLEYMRTQSRTADVTSLNFSGTEQLTDAFLFILHDSGISLPNVEEIYLNGCYHLTDDGIQFLTKYFDKLKIIELAGCKKLTEVSLLTILDKFEITWRSINMSATNVGLVPPGVERSIKLDGCPLVSPPEAIYRTGPLTMAEKTSRPSKPQNCYKMVILTEANLPWSPLAVILGEKDVAPTKKLRVKKNWSFDKTSVVNIFEVPIDSGFSELLVSEGCIVVLPYLLADDGPDQDYAEEIVRNMAKIFAKCPDCLFLTMGMSEEPGLENVEWRYRNILKQNFQKRASVLLKELDLSYEKNYIFARMYFSHQEMFAAGQILYTQSENIDCDNGMTITDNSNVYLLQSVVLHVGGDVKKPLETVMKNSISSLRHHFPWHFISEQNEMSSAVTEIEQSQFPLCSLQKVCEKFVSTKTQVSLHPSGAYSHIAKICNCMKVMGKALHFLFLAGSPTLTNFSFLEEVYEKLMCSPAPRRASWRYLGPNIPCWTRADLQGLCTSTDLEETLPVLLQLLEKMGILLKFPRDLWTSEVTDTVAYILYKHLPQLPPTDVDKFWPEDVPDDEMQAERYFTFVMGLPDSFFPSVLRHCMKLGGVRLMWNHGLIIQKGPVTVLVELLSSYDYTPIITVSSRLPATIYDYTNPHLTAMWSMQKIYLEIIHMLTIKYKIYAAESVPCVTCLPSRNRYKTANSRSSEVWLMREQYVRGSQAASRSVTCRNDGSSINVSAVLGPVHLSGTKKTYEAIVASHYYLGCLPSFSEYNRCMMCHSCAVDGPECEGNLKNGKTAWNCSCEREGQMCDKCGMCQRCITFLSNLFCSTQPYFQESGNLISIVGGKAHQVDYELSPNYCPVLEVTMMENCSIDIEVQISHLEKLVYTTVPTTIKKVNIRTNSTEELTSDDYPCDEGCLVEVELVFVPEDFDLMEIVFRRRGCVFYRHRCATQGCLVTLRAQDPSSLLVSLPRLKHYVQQEADEWGEWGEKEMCSSSSAASGLEARLIHGKQFVENALFQVGGVNYSGSAIVTLPSNLTMEKFQFPSFQLIKYDMLYHALCYTRTKVSDAMVLGGATPAPESWAAYRMIHLVDSEGFSVEPKKQLVIESKAQRLLWAWHLLMICLPKVCLPKSRSKFLADDFQEVDLPKVEVGLRDLLQLVYWRLLLRDRLDLDALIPMFEDLYKLTPQVKILHDVVDSNLEKTGLGVEVSQYNLENCLYLCPGHIASMKMEAGLTTVMPEIYGQYSQFLMSVDMPSNELREIPGEMFLALPNLAEFDCSNNFIEELPSTIGLCKNLFSLTVRENNLVDLPETLVNCTELARLDMNENVMECIPPVVTRLTSLLRLYASHMMLTSLPEDIGNLVNLEKLYLYGNCLTSLPDSFSNLKALNDLALCGVPWIAKTKTVISFENFQKFFKKNRMEMWLDAHNEDKKELFKYFDEDSNGILDEREIGKLNAAIFNMFPRFGYKGLEPPEDDTASGFPMVICSLRNLENLNFYYQGFVSVPPEISQLTELKIVNFSHNPNLLSLPAELGMVTSLTRLELEECPLLKTPPKEIRAKGFATTFAYLQRLMSGSVSCKRTKLMMVGLGGAGKTSLVKALMSSDNKSEFLQGEAITDGIDISTWTVSANDEHITYSVWDFAGQTVYYNTHQFFLSNRAVYVLLWNVRLGYEHAGLDFWLSSISVQAPKAPIFVVGSHIDQVSKYQLPINEMKQRYRQIAGFFFVSSYNGEGVRELQDGLFAATLQEQYMGEQIPEVWLNLENMVTNARSERNVIDYTALERMANVSGIFDKTEIYQAVQFLHELGSLQHFTTESLKDKVVINPQWIVDVMACVVSVKNSPIKDGRLNHSDIAKVWQDYPADLHSWLLKLTEEYDLTFPMENEPANLVPCLLPDQEPELTTWPDLEKGSDIKENRMVYKFDYLPTGLFNRGQVRLHQISDSSLIWKKGSFLNKNGHKALIKHTRDSELVVTVQGPRPENVLFLVHEVFEGLIAESFRGVTYDYLIPCPDCLRNVLKDPHMFAASTIRRALELKAPFLQCVKYFHTISCVDLLACMPPDNHSDFDLHLVQSVRNLRDLRKDLSTDIFMCYCPKDAPVSRGSVCHPAQVCDDLTALGYKCWFPGVTEKFTMDEMAQALIDAEVFVAFISNDYVNDESCTNRFKYARMTLRKPMVVVVVGDNLDWKQSKLGLLLADEVFINMTKAKRPNYKTKFEELVRTLGERTNRQIGTNPTPSCFFSYTWVNSAQAVSLGTRSVPGAIGYGDPREIKKYLEDNNVRCWIDVERVGVNGLFDDIAEGLLSAKVVVICVSDEYAASQTCRIEFRYAANSLRLPIIMAVVGKGNKWRASEVGILSLEYPLVSFQERSETAHASLLSLVKTELEKAGESPDKERKQKQTKEHKNISFQELFELSQRKLLRQLSFYAEHQDTDIYPRLFVVDFAKPRPSAAEIEKQEAMEEEKEKIPPPLLRTTSVDKVGLMKRFSELHSQFKRQRFCVHILCEHDEGWHSITEPLPLPDDFGANMLENYAPFLARVTAIMKYNRHLVFNYVQSELGESYISWLEETPQATLSDFQQVYHDFRQMVIDADIHRTMGNLARCRLPNGKTIWLCQKHHSNMRVTLLSTEVADTKKETFTDSNTTNHMITGLRSIDYKHFSDKFTSTRKSKRRKEGTSDSAKDNSPRDGDSEKTAKTRMLQKHSALSTKKIEKYGLLDKETTNKETAFDTQQQQKHQLQEAQQLKAQQQQQQQLQEQLVQQQPQITQQQQQQQPQMSKQQQQQQPQMSQQQQQQPQMLQQQQQQPLLSQQQQQKQLVQQQQQQKQLMQEQHQKQQQQQQLRQASPDMNDTPTGLRLGRAKTEMATPQASRRRTEQRPKSSQEPRQKPKSKLCNVM